MPMVNLVRAGFGSWKEIIDMKNTEGLDKLLELNNILSILHQEDMLDHG